MNFSLLSPNKHAFVTEADLVTAKRFEAQIHEIEVAAVSVRPDNLAAKVHNARNAYVSSPTTENFEALKQAQVEYAVLREDRRAKSMTAHAVNTLYKEHIAPWARTVLERALSAASKRLEQVTKEESDRVLALTGAAMTQPNDIVLRAKRDVDRLTRLMELPGRLVRSQIRPARLIAMFGFGKGPTAVPQPAKLTVARTVPNRGKRKKSRLTKSKRNIGVMHHRNPKRKTADFVFLPGAEVDEGVFPSDGEDERTRRFVDRIENNGGAEQERF